MTIDIEGFQEIAYQSQKFEQPTESEWLELELYTIKLHILKGE